MVVPVYIERIDDFKFRLTINNPLQFEKNETVDQITLKLNQVLEKMI